MRRHNVPHVSSVVSLLRKNEIAVKKSIDKSSRREEASSPLACLIGSARWAFLASNSRFRGYVVIPVEESGVPEERQP